MNGLDVEAVLRDHQISAFGPEDAACSCDRTWRKHAAHRAHVAAVLRVEIDRELEDAWDEGYGDDLTCHEPRSNPYRPTLAATEGD